MERLPDTSQAGTLRGLKTIQADEMAVDLEESSTMDVDNENGRPQKRFFFFFFFQILSSFFSLNLRCHVMISKETVS